jgi:hypothetical protein
MKKKYLLLLATIAVIAACVFVVVVVLPTRSGVTQANFDRIKRGMSPAQVAEIFGQPPSERNDLGDPFFINIYRHADGSFAWVLFKKARGVPWSEDRVCDSDWRDSNETFWDKLRRWVGLK